MKLKKNHKKNSKKIKIKRIRIKFKRKKLWIILNWRDKLKIKINSKKQLKGKTTRRMRIKSKKIKNLNWRIRLKSIESFFKKRQEKMNKKKEPGSNLKN